MVFDCFVGGNLVQIQEEQPCAVMASLRSKHLEDSLVFFARQKGRAKKIDRVLSVSKNSQNSSASILVDVLFCVVLFV